MSTQKQQVESLLALSDLLRDEVVCGWAIPIGATGEFLKAVQRAACDAGAIPFSQMDFLEFDETVASLIRLDAKGACAPIDACAS